MKLTAELLISAYSQGFFPMPDKEGNIRWYRPNPRAIIPLDNFHVSKSLRRLINKNPFTVTFDSSFQQVMEACANRSDTWITPEFIEVYTQLFKKGYAHSVEIWKEGTLVGGAYGPAIGKAFFAESMFHTVTNASKLALYFLVEKLKELDFQLLEIQFLTPHLESLGAIEITDDHYIEILEKALIS